jgi:hypothetical protein
VFSFHNGVDIAAWPGNRVYPVVSGRVEERIGDRVVVRSPHGRRFQYIHVRPWVSVGERVIASRTVLGTVFAPWNHVHLTEVRDGCVVNPLTTGHLEPYVDRTRPRVIAITFTSLNGRRLDPSSLQGPVEAIATAQDRPTVPGPGVWRRMPVAPALVTWRLATATGRTARDGVAADFMVTLPPAADFCAIYAPGTLQNFAAENGRFNWARPGRYRFYLTRQPLDTSRMPPGRYVLTVTAADTGGNTGNRSVVIGIRHSRIPTAATALPDWRCQTRSLANH